MISRVSTVDWEEDIYRRGKQINRWPYSDLVSAVKREVTHRKPSEIRVLEIGCGTGNNLRFFLEEGFQASGIDYAESAVRVAREQLSRYSGTLDIVVGDMLELPWSNEYFDFVIDRGALTQNEYSQVERMLSEAYRVLKPGGTLLAFTLKGLNHPDRQFGEMVSKNAYDRFTDGKYKNIGLTAFFSLEDIEQLFGKFQNLEIKREVTYSSSNQVLDEEFSVRAERP